jgi:UDP-glucose 4-epimerase
MSKGTGNGKPAGAGRKVLITGGMGFVGSHLAEVLLEQGDRVTLVDNLSTGRADNVRHLEGHPNLRLAVHDVNAGVPLDEFVAGSDVVFHLAAAVGVKLIVENPVETVSTNVAGTERVLQAAARHGVKVLIASTSEVYGKATKLPFSEDDDVVLGASSRSRWCYAASKLVDEFVGLGYYHQKQLPVVIFRLFNTVGPRQSGQYGMVVPRFVRAAIDGKPLTVHGDGSQSRCFTHVRDAVAAINALSVCETAPGQVFNIGSTEPVTILELANRVVRAVDGADSSDPGRLTFLPYDEVYGPGFEDMKRRMPDIAKIAAHTGWSPRRSLDDILQDVIEDMSMKVRARSQLESASAAA